MPLWNLLFLLSNLLLLFDVYAHIFELVLCLAFNIFSLFCLSNVLLTWSLSVFVWFVCLVLYSSSVPGRLCVSQDLEDCM
jgi:hypothetical protein